ncbi:MAG: DUF2203 family protein [Candidatus Omnitrophica bacterium]|nr:DUF2203 family protein [Candidatus Omnitrophota bacterium]
MNTSRPKVFQLEEANSLVPQLETFLAELEEKQHSFDRLHDELFFEELVEEARLPETKFQELEKTLEELAKSMEKIQGLGCVLRHVRRGLVDFLAKEGEKMIYYCWRRGEKEIQFYHPLRGGLFERRPLAGASR